MRTPRRRREIPGVQTRCSPGCDPTARTNPLKSARAVAAVKAKASTTLIMLASFAHARDSELPLESCELLEIDRADDVHDLELLRLSRQNHETGNGIALRP